VHLDMLQQIYLPEELVNFAWNRPSSHPQINKSTPPTRPYWNLLLAYRCAYLSWSRWSMKRASPDSVLCCVTKHILLGIPPHLLTITMNSVFCLLCNLKFHWTLALSKRYAQLLSP
jgi:hypothetical protein